MVWREKPIPQKGNAPETGIPRERTVFAAFLYDHRDCLVVFAVLAGCFSSVSYAFRYPFAAIGYALLLGLLLVVCFLTVAYFPYRRRYFEMLHAAREEYVDLIPVEHGREAAYQALFASLREKGREREAAHERENRENGAYYSTWVHQVKVPIAAIRLILEEDTPDRRAMQLELSRIEQYADMVLAYQRLRDHVSDYVFRECDLAVAVNGVIRKLAPWFIRKKLTLHYDKSPCHAVTDEKWFSLIAEQLLSNAIKYTAPGGVITVRCTTAELIVSDTGIGIAPEDLPRIFERGFTGVNGRIHEHATGIGLYLCRQICDRLGYTIHVTSTPRVGSTFTVCLQPEENAAVERQCVETTEKL